MQSQLRASTSNSHKLGWPASAKPGSTTIRVSPACVSQSAPSPTDLWLSWVACCCSAGGGGAKATRPSIISITSSHQQFHACRAVRHHRACSTADGVSHATHARPHPLPQHPSPGHRVCGPQQSAARTAQGSQQQRPTSGAAARL